MKSLNVTIYLLLVFLVLPASSYADELPKQLPNLHSISQTDKRLLKPVSMEVVGISLKDLLTKLSSEELKLEGSRECGNERFQLRIVERPLYQVLDFIAEMVPGSWLKVSEGKKPDSYYLKMNPSAIRKRNTWWDIFTESRKKSLDLSRDALLSKMRSKPNSYLPGNNFSGSLDAAKELEETEAFYYALPGKLQEKLANLVYLNDPAELIKGNTRHTAALVKISELPEGVQDKLRSKNPDLAGRNAILLFSVTPNAVSLSYIHSKGHVLSAGYGLSAVSVSSMFNQIDGDIYKYLKQTQTGSKSHLDDTQKVLSDFANTVFWKNDPPKPLRSGSSPIYHWSHILSVLAKDPKFEYISDHYYKPDLPLTDKERRLIEASPLEDELNFQAKQQGMSWKKEKDIYLFRQNKWFRDYARQVPEQLIQTWNAAVSKENLRLSDTKNPLTTVDYARMYMEWGAEISSKLSPWAIDYGLCNYVNPKFLTLPTSNSIHKDWKPFAHYAAFTLENYHLLRFYSMLSAQQRQELFEGKLVFGALTKELQERAFQLLPEMVEQSKQESIESVRLTLQFQQLNFHLRLITDFNISTNSHRQFDIYLSVAK